MKWSFRLTTIAGTEVRIHLTFFLLLAFVAMQGMAGGRGMAGALDATLLVSAMFLCVLLHEFGHVFAARGYGIRTPDITLLPIGGLARLERMPRNPAHEFVVAVCGPLVNVGIAAAIWLIGGITLGLDPEFQFHQAGHFWEKLMVWNLLMVVFNMIPAFPMDGGRVFRAVLAMFLDYGRATRWAASVGQGIALVVVIVMLLSGQFQPVLLLIAFFIFMAAGQESAHVQQQEATRNMRVRDAMLTDFQVLPHKALLRDGVDLLLAGSQQDFPVLNESGTLQGMLTRRGLISKLSEHGPGYPAELVAESCPDQLHPATELGDAMTRLQASGLPALPVVDPLTGDIVGLLTSENVGETLMVRAALRDVRSAVA
jgi:stage IV sporulation protein FB